MPTQDSEPVRGATENQGVQRNKGIWKDKEDKNKGQLDQAHESAYELSHLHLTWILQKRLAELTTFFSPPLFTKESRLGIMSHPGLQFLY